MNIKHHKYPFPLEAKNLETELSQQSAGTFMENFNRQQTNRWIIFNSWIKPNLRPHINKNNYILSLSLLLLLFHLQIGEES